MLRVKYLFPGATIRIPFCDGEAEQVAGDGVAEPSHARSVSGWRAPAHGGGPRSGGQASLGELVRNTSQFPGFIGSLQHE